jgi:uncharacterized protein (DUF2267 family)
MDDRTFIREVADRLHADERRAEAVVFAVLQELRDRLTPEEAADVAAQLPAALRHLWQENEQPNREVRRIHREEFVGRVRRTAALPDDREAERGIRAVFATLQKLLGSARGTTGEAWHVFSQLPKDLKILWLAAGAGAPC